MAGIEFRLQVKAGLTGYAQVTGLYDTLPYDKLKMDLMYIENYSIFMDLRIILMTLKLHCSPGKPMKRQMRTMRRSCCTRRNRYRSRKKRKEITHESDRSHHGRRQRRTLLAKSRGNYPKQFLSLTKDGETMIQKTVKRLLPMVAMEDVFVVTNVSYAALVKEQLPQLPEENILLEPCARNTAPCIGLAAAVIRKKVRRGNDAGAALRPPHPL